MKKYTRKHGPTSHLVKHKHDLKHCTVRMEHFCDEADDRGFVWVVLGKLQGKLECTCRPMTHSADARQFYSWDEKQRRQ